MNLKEITSRELLNKIKSEMNDPNIREVAKRELFNNYTQAQVDERANNINSALNQYAEQAQSNIETRVREENEARQELRERYLEELESATGVIE